MKIGDFAVYFVSTFSAVKLGIDPHGIPRRSPTPATDANQSIQTNAKPKTDGSLKRYNALFVFFATNAARDFVLFLVIRSGGISL